VSAIDAIVTTLRSGVKLETRDVSQHEVREIPSHFALCLSLAAVRLQPPVRRATLAHGGWCFDGSRREGRARHRLVCASCSLSSPAIFVERTLRAA
jgi:hypothetical protein